MRARFLGTLILGASAVAGCSDGSASGDRLDARDSSATGRSRETGPDGASFDVRIVAAESTYFRGAYDSARTIWAEVVQDARAAGDPLPEARALTWMGLAAWKQADYPAATRLGEAALALKLRFRLEDELFKSYNALGLVAWNEGRLSRAKALFEEGVQSARSSGDAKGVAGTSANLALVQTDLGEFAEARAGFTTALDAGRTLGDERIQGNTLANLGMLDLRVGDPRSAVSRLREARRLYRSIGYPAGEHNVLGQLGVAYASMGEQPAAFAALDSALALVRAHGLRQEEADNLEEIADFHRQAGDLRSALRIYEEARELNTELGRLLEAGDDLRSQAEIQAALGEVALAQRNAAEALRVHREAGATLSELDDLLLLGSLAAAAGDPAGVERHFSEARAAANRLGTPPARLAVALGEARIADLDGDARRALEVLDDVAADLSSAGYADEGEAHALRARALASLGLLDSAATVGRHAVAALERTRGELGSPILRTAYLAEKGGAYTDLVSVLLRLERPEEAFEVADAARGRALLEHLRSADVDPGTQRNVTARALARGEELLRRIDALTAHLDETGSEPADPAASRLRAELSSQLAAARTEYEELVARASDRHAAEAAFLGAVSVRAPDVQIALQEGEALLEYLVTSDGVLLFVVTRETVAVFRSSISRGDLESRIRVAQDFLRRPSDPRGGRRALPVLAALHETLLGPAKRAGALRGARRLIVVPHQALVYLPFAALRDRAKNRYLIEDHSLLVLPSAAALPLLRRPGGTLPEDIDGSRPHVFTPFPDALPGTVAEARAFARALPRARVHAGAEATEARVRAALAEPGVVHVASHAKLNVTNPLFSTIELQGASAGSSWDDGRLEIHELLGLPIASDLVFLSGCETGLGSAWSTSFARGDDYATLSQTLLYAGAHNVIATLWAVEDAGSAAFAERFYRALTDRPPPEALAEAQRRMLDDAKYGAPYYWAGYELSGAGELGGVAPSLMASEAGAPRRMILHRPRRLS